MYLHDVEGCRHAESMEQPDVRDHERDISAAGVQAARSVAAHLRDLGWLPDLLLGSNSKRTKQTVDAMSEAVSHFGEVDAHYLGTLYTISALDGQTQSHLAMRVCTRQRSASPVEILICLECLSYLWIK